MFDLNQIFKRTDAIQRHLAAPLVQSRLSYLAHCAEQGAKPSTLRGIAAHQVRLIHHLGLGTEGKVTRSEIEAAAKRWAFRDPGRRNGDPDTARCNFVSHAIGWLRFLDRLEVQEGPAHPYSAELAEYVNHMRLERGWSEATVRGHRGRADDFLRRFCASAGALADVTTATIDRALNERNARNGRPRRPSTIRTHADCLRSFLLFSEGRGWSRPGLAALIVAPRVFRDAALPLGPSRMELRSLIEATEGDRLADLRDRALLLTLSAYGLRSGEVAGLLVGDINWEAETLRVRRPKTGRIDLFPLSRRVGDAVARYLCEVRQRTDHREIFLALTAPVRPLGASAISDVVRRRMQRCGIDCPRRGAHALRHAFAQHLLDEGFSMQEIGDCLGHRNLDSTAIYAKVDLAGLRQVAQFDLEGLA